MFHQSPLIAKLLK